MCHAEEMNDCAAAGVEMSAAAFRLKTEKIYYDQKADKGTCAAIDL